MDKLDKLKAQYLKHCAELEALRRATGRKPVERSHKTWMRQAKELREQGRLN